MAARKRSPIRSAFLILDGRVTELMEISRLFPYDETMNKKTVISKLKAHKTELRKLGVAHLSLFDLVARDEQNSRSDN